MDWLSPLRDLSEFALPSLNLLPVIRAILAFILVFFLPGFAWSLVFFYGKQISVIERIVLSFGLSIALVTLSIFGLNLLIGIRITGLNSLLVIIGVTIIPISFYFLRQFISSRRGGSAQ